MKRIIILLLAVVIFSCKYKDLNFEELGKIQSTQLSNSTIIVDTDDAFVQIKFNEIMSLDIPIGEQAFYVHDAIRVLSNTITMHYPAFSWESAERVYPVSQITFKSNLFITDSSN